MRIKNVASQLTILFAIFLTGVAAQKPGPPAPASLNIRGSVESGKYINPYFGFELQLPDKWISLDQGETDTAIQMTAEASRSGNAEADRLIEQAADTSTTLFFFAKGPFGSIENASIAMTAKKMQSKVITAKMILEATKSALLKNPKTTLVSDVEMEMIGGRQFAKMEMGLDMAGNPAPIRYYTTIPQGYALTVSISSLSPEAGPKAEASLRSIKFKTK
ncbi:MAG: hypothetical protein ABJB34_10995 [Acidobacteriota bacterium]